MPGIFFREKKSYKLRYLYQSNTKKAEISIF